ncbi:unnamed protein product [Prorocentrum cordatum]|uniref:Fanconi-associated nuclease n=1 Tax=Prorocentrum cordatum TaxID=2364126 RepID=A0ABN9T9M7_9DINO|nr:unnamed protein product [Polarella glacialis]
MRQQESFSRRQTYLEDRFYLRRHATRGSVKIEERTTTQPDYQAHNTTDHDSSTPSTRDCIQKLLRAPLGPNTRPDYANEGATAVMMQAGVGTLETDSPTLQPSARQRARQRKRNAAEPTPARGPQSVANTRMPLPSSDSPRCYHHVLPAPGRQGQRRTAATANALPPPLLTPAAPQLPETGATASTWRAKATRASPRTRAARKRAAAAGEAAESTLHQQSDHRDHPHHAQQHQRDEEHHSGNNAHDCDQHHAQEHQRTAQRSDQDHHDVHHHEQQHQRNPSKSRRDARWGYRGVREVTPHHGAGRDTPTQEACCGAHFHLGCRADLARHLGEATTCPQCRARLPTTAELRAWCAAQGVDIDRPPPPARDASAQAVPDYSGFRSYARGEEPPPREPPLLRALCCRRLGPPPEFSEVPDRRVEWSPEIAARDTNGMITQWLESWLCPRCGARCAVDAIAPQSGQQMCARCLEQGAWTAEAGTAEGEWRCALCEPDAWTREARTNSAVHVPLLLAAAGLLDPSEGAQWSEHRLTQAPQEPELPGDQHANGPAAVVGRGGPSSGSDDGNTGAEEGDANDGGSNSSTEETDHEAEPAQAPAPSNGPTEESWAALGGIDLQQELRRFVPTLQNVPRFLRAETRMAFTTALQRIKRGHDQGNQATTHQGWTLFLLASRLLLSKPKGADAEGRQELLERAQRFRQGDWLALLHEANTTAGARAAPRPATEEQQQERRREQACAHVRNGNLSRGRQVLTAVAIAPGNGETLNRLRDPARRPPTLGRRLPANLDRATDRARLDKTKFLACLRSAKKGTAAGPSGVRVEHLKPLLEHEESMDLLGFAAAALAEARVPSPIARALALCKMTALQKPDNAAYWGAWADALHMLHQRRPVEAAAIRDLLDGTRPGRRGNLAAAAAAAQLLETEGFRRPSWTDLLQGLRPEAPPRSEAAEPGEWQHGWQFHACSARNTHYRDNVFMPSLTRANQAMLRSGSGPRAAYWLHTLPTTEGHVFKPARFLAALRRRLRLPLPLLPHTCGAAGHPGCRARLDTLGDHLAACPRTGLLARRAKPLERAWARVAREAGGRVVPQQLLRDTNAVVHNPLDRRQLDLVVYGISPNGVPLCCDSTMVSPLRRDGWHRPRTFDTDGAALLGAERRKRRRYHELTTGHSGRLMVLSCEVGGRWGRDSLQLVRLLAKQKARAAPALLRRSAELAYTNRWWGFLSVAAQDSLMATLTGDGYLALGGAAGEDDPDLAEVLLADSAGPPASRLPARP